MYQGIIVGLQAWPIPAALAICLVELVYLSSFITESKKFMKNHRGILSRSFAVIIFFGIAAWFSLLTEKTLSGVPVSLGFQIAAMIALVSLLLFALYAAILEGAAAIIKGRSQ